MVQGDIVDIKDIAIVDCINHKSYQGKILDNNAIFEMVLCEESDIDYRYHETDMKAAIIRDNVVAIRTISNQKT